MTQPDDPRRGVSRPPASASSRGSPTPAPRAGRDPDDGHARRGLQDRRRPRRCATRSRPGSTSSARTGSRRRAAKVARGPRRALAAGRAAPVEQGAPGARGLRRRSRRSTRSTSRGGSTGSCREVRPGRAATRSCSRSTSTSIRPRPASRPTTLEAALRRARSTLPHLAVGGLMTVGRLVDRPGGGARDVPRPARARRSGCRARLAGARPGAVDGDERRLRDRGRGGRDDRPGRSRAVRRAAARHDDRTPAA